MHQQHFRPILGRWAVSLLLLAALLAGCNSSDDSSSSHSHEATTVSYTIPVMAMMGTQTAACNRDYTGIGSPATTVQLMDIRFYLSSFKLIKAGGGTQAMTLTASDWQTTQTVLLDFEDSTGECSSNTPEMNTAIRGTAPAGDYIGLQFDLGVPFNENHTDVASAPAPLDSLDLDWGWTIGRKFMKVEYHVPANTSDAYWPIHLGSTGCTGDGSTAPAVECTNPNRPTIVLPTFDPAADTLKVDLAALVSGSDLTVQNGMMSGCMSFTPDTNCPEVFTNLGLDIDTGVCDDDCADQALFSTM